jgi:hemerythrin-like domain-containing protein
VGGDAVNGDPLRRLEAEHREALAALLRLELAALALEAGAPPEPHLQTVREVLAILTTAVRAHNESEEAALFPVLADQAPSAVFVDEHRELRALEQRLGHELDEPRSVRAIAATALAIVELLRAHITREDEVLFPMARALLGPEGLAAVARQLDR